MENEYEIHVATSIEIKSIKITECTSDEAMAFAIVLFEKYARQPADKIFITSRTAMESTRMLILNERGRVEIV